MIISRTPFRISFLGGGTDYPDWFKENGGSVLSTTIDKYCYITCRYMPPFFDYKYLLRYYKREEVKRVDEINHPTIRETIKLLNVEKGIELVHYADLPAQSGLGSSSTFTVGFLNALHILQKKMVSKIDLAKKAIYIEQFLIKENVGSQDQCAAAIGGLNNIKFYDNNKIISNKLNITNERKILLQDNLLLFFTGLARSASKTAEEQIKNIKSKKIDLNEMVKSVDIGIGILENSSNLNDFGYLLHEQWQIKKSLSSLITNSFIDDIYDKGIKSGAKGGKLLGAGAGGFILFYAEKEFHQSIKDSLKTFLHVPFNFEDKGSTIIYKTEGLGYES